MSTTPAWLAASPGSACEAGQVNQFLGSHTSSFVYTGLLQTSQTTGGAVYNDTYTQWNQQSFTTGASQTSLAYVMLQISAVGGSPTSQLISPLVVSIYADAIGVPTGSPLVSATLASSTVYSSPFWLTVPLPTGSLTPNTVYHIVVPKVGTSTHYYAWQRGNPGTRAATSPDGLTWTSQTYGFMFQVYSQSTSGMKAQYIYEDAGNRTITLSYGSNGTLTGIKENTIAQAPNDFLIQSRTLNYTNGLFTGAS